MVKMMLRKTGKLGQQDGVCIYLSHKVGETHWSRRNVHLDDLKGIFFNDHECSTRLYSIWMRNSVLIPPFCFNSKFIHLAVPKHPDIEEGIHKSSMGKYSWNWKDSHSLIWDKPDSYIGPLCTVWMWISPCRYNISLKWINKQLFWKLQN